MRRFDLVLWLDLDGSFRVQGCNFKVALPERKWFGGWSYLVNSATSVLVLPLLCLAVLLGAGTFVSD
jgi:hypothetical protein